jgi:ABC-type Fe3+-hydroxamate transport system substrate-binding protein
VSGGVVTVTVTDELPNTVTVVEQPVEVVVTEESPSTVTVSTVGLQGPVGPSNVWVGSTPPPSTSMVWVDTSV